MINEININIAKFLSLPESDEFDIYHKFVYLLQSINGDDYFLRVLLVEQGLISEDFANTVYEVITNDISYKDILDIYMIWNS